MPFPNPEQSAVIEAVRDSLLVLAPMGTGKTRTAAAAVRRAIELGITPERVLGLTFTNRAAEAMRAAVAEALPEESHRVHLFNLHGLCARLLREEGPLAGLPPDFGILDEDEAAELLWEFIPRGDREERYKKKPAEALNAYEKFVFRFLMGEKDGPTPPEFIMYRDAMHRDGTVDFTGLIARAYRVLKTSRDALERWQTRHEWMLVDEVQDINLAEYRMIALLGGKHRCVKFFGDTHQTIYEWRFAQPREVIESFERDFQPRALALKKNYRCATILVDATNALRRDSIPSAEPFPEAGADLDGGEIQIEHFEHASDETQGVVARVKAWRRDGIPASRIAILSRQNRTLVEISTALREAEIPHLVAEDFDFFRRKEVKDVTAVLAHLVSPFRRHPIQRLLKHFAARVGALDAFEKAARGTGLHLGYLVRGAAGDPLHPLIEAWRAERIVALDTETTGLDPATAEVIQLARITSARDVEALLRSAASADSFCEWIRPSGKVGESVRTHGVTDEFLAANGKDPRDVLTRGLRLAEGEILLGHNLAFDLRLLREQCARLGISTRFPLHFDTMSLAAGVLPDDKLSGGLRLESVCKALGVELPRAHDAGADAQACLDILAQIMPQLIERQETRMKLIADMGSELGLAFRRVTELFRHAAAKEAEGLGIADLILAVWAMLRDTPGSHDYRTNETRAKNIEDLANVAQFLETRHRGALSLPAFLEQVSLSRRDMMLEVDPERVRLLSAHAAKGLEFDAVAIPRLVAPWNGYTDEEARVFYVMLTRARQKVWMSWPSVVRTQWGAEQRVEMLKYIASVERFAAREAES